MSLPERALGDVLDIAIDDEAMQPDRDYPIAGVYGFGRGLFQRGPIRSDETSYPKLNRLTAGRLVMSRLKAFEGAIAVIPPEFDGWYLSPEFPTFSINATLADARYIANLCSWPEFWARLGAQSKGVGARKVRVNAERLLAIKLPLPRLDEQRRIAARLDSALSRLRQTDKLREHREILRKSLTQSAVFTAVSQSTGSVSLGSLMSVSRTPIEILPGDKHQALGMRSFGKGIIRYEPVPGRELSKLRYYKFPVQALALSNIKAWEGAIGVTDDRDTACVASNRFLFYSPKDDRINVSYTRHYLLSREGIAKIGAASPGSADRNRTLSIQGFEAIEIPLPPRGVQDSTARLIDSISAGLAAPESTASGEALKFSLLNAAFSGRL
jgi:type I restriction enzyme S subunit